MSVHCPTIDPVEMPANLVERNVRGAAFGEQPFDVEHSRFGGDGRWVPPGDVLELDETPQECVVREVLEETGVKIEPERLIGVYKNMKLGVVSLAFLCRPVVGDPHTTNEATAVAWVSRSEGTDAMPEARAVRVTDAFRSDGPLVGVHDGTSLLFESR